MGPWWLALLAARLAKLRSDVETNGCGFQSLLQRFERHPRSVVRPCVPIGAHTEPSDGSGIDGLDGGGVLIEGQGLLARSVEILRADPAEFVRLVRGKARRLLGLPRDRTVGRIGSIRFEFDFQLDSPTLSMMWRRTYQPEVAIAMRRHLGRGSTFVDVGANLGYFSAIGADLVGSAGRVIAVEPAPPFVTRLARLQQMNPSYDIQLMPVAAGDEVGTRELFLNRGDNVGAHSFARDAVPEPSDPVVVDVVRLDEYLTGDVDLIKIDVEGFEVQVLRGLTDCLDAIGRPPIICEWNPLHHPTLGTTGDDIRRVLTMISYEATDLLVDRPIDVRTVTGLRDVLLRPSKKP
jgi:FkbM family methyltransferase